jgi:outer membrane protein assembly factor BamB
MSILQSSLIAFVVLAASAADVPQWPQFRGPSGAGVAAENAAPPIEFGPASHVAWRADSGVGHGSLCISGNQIFLLSFDKAGSLLATTSLDRGSGKVLWRQSIPAKEIEPYHVLNNPASSTPATDGERLYVYFGSYGLAAYTLEGKPAWSHPLPTANHRFGSGTSPVLEGDLLLLAPAGPGAKVFAFNRGDGTLKWEAAVPSGGMQGTNGHSTPVVWNGQVVLHGAGAVFGFDLRDGKVVWGLGAHSNGTGTPVAGKEMIFVPTWSNTGDTDFIPSLPPWSEMLSRYDTDKDGRISSEEIREDVFLMKRPDVPDSTPNAHFSVKRFFPQLDGNHDGYLAKNEWEQVRAMMSSIVRPHGLVAIKPGGKGDIAKTHVAWSQPKNVPEVPSPLVYHNRLYMVTNGGIVTCLDEGDGHLVFRGRLGTPGEYYASPVAGGGRLYFISRDGVVTVIADGTELKVLARSELSEEVFASPAIVGDTLYVRTAAHVYAFRGDGKAK